MPEGDWSPTASAAVLLGAAAILVFTGTRFVRIVDRLADRTGIGEALAGAVLLGATTSLPGLVTTGVAAAKGAADLALSNAFGGIAAQTAFLALADLVYRRANLEHAAASVPNLLQSTFLTALLALVAAGIAVPQLAFGGIHPVSLLLPVAYVYGLVLARRAGEEPMWHARRTRETRLDVPDEAARHESLPRLWGGFLVLAVLVAGSGWAVARAGVSLASTTQISGTLVGGFVTSIVTSLPELVTAVAAVRAGALTLAVADIVGGNAFDVLFVSVADAAHPGASVLAVVRPETLFLLALTIVLTSTLTAGLVYRERRGIGFEGVAILALWAAGLAVVSLA